MGPEKQGWIPKFDYYLDESDPDILVLRRQNGSFVAAFSAQGAKREGILEAAAEDYRRLISHLRAGRQRAAFLDELPEEAAVVEGSGTIVAVNKAWRLFAKDNGTNPGEVSEGVNYLSVCAGARGEQSEYARSFAEDSVPSLGARKSALRWNTLATRPKRSAGSWGAWGAWPTAMHHWLSSPTRT